MNVVQWVAMIGVALAGTAVVFVADPLRQTLVLGIYGLSLTFMFFAALRKIRSADARREDREESE